MLTGAFDAWLNNAGHIGVAIESGDGQWIDRIRNTAAAAPLFVIPQSPASMDALRNRVDPSLIVASLPYGTDPAEGTTITSFCQENVITHIHYLRVAPGVALDKVIADIDLMLHHTRIDFVEIPADYASRFVRNAVLSRLARDEYRIISETAAGLSLVPPDGFFNLDGNAPLLAIHARILPLIQRSSTPDAPVSMLDLRSLLAEHAISWRGVIHLGAFVGAEVADYVANGASNVLLVEANPELLPILNKVATEFPSARVVHCAINNVDGPVELRLASFRQSSSILPMKHHLVESPDIVEASSVSVPGYRLDSLMDREGLDASCYNVMSIDIQGAELRALEGAEKTLQHIEAVNVEINFKEMYAGCAQIEDIDNFLNARGLFRVSTVTPFSPNWGDALYIRRNAA